MGAGAGAGERSGQVAPSNAFDPKLGVATQCVATAQALAHAGKSSGVNGWSRKKS